LLPILATYQAILSFTLLFVAIELATSYFSDQEYDHDVLLGNVSLLVGVFVMILFVANWGLQ
jgi:uncharacterized membrane protein